MFQFYFRGHEAYLKGAPNYNFPMYRQLVHEITETFKKISDEILTMNETFKTKHNLLSISKLISNIQEEEKQKLEKV